MSHKSKGINAERELIHLFWAQGWAAVRVSGSGSMKYPSPDVIAATRLRRLAIECKSTKDEHKYIPKAGIEQLKTFAGIINAEPWIAIRFNALPWYFLMIEDMRATGQNMMVTVRDAQKKGLLFEELIRR